MSEQVLSSEQEPKPVDSVRLVVRSQQAPSRFLLVAEADDPENWKLPGGRFEGAETPEQAMQREALEELRLEGALGESVELLNDDGISSRFIFAIEADEEQISLEPDEGDDPERIIGRMWVTRRYVEASDLKNKNHILKALDAEGILAQA